MTINKQCCHGFARGRNGGACEKVDYVNVAETAEILGGKQFVKSAINNDLKEIMESNITVFMPLDERFMEFSEQMFENVSFDFN